MMMNIFYIYYFFINIYLKFNINKYIYYNYV